MSWLMLRRSASIRRKHHLYLVNTGSDEVWIILNETAYNSGHNLKNFPSSWKALSRSIRSMTSASIGRPTLPANKKSGMRKLRSKSRINVSLGRAGEEP